jgi:PAS domain S-box-containing protein
MIARMDKFAASPPALRARDAHAVGEQSFRLLVESVRDYAIFLLDPAGRVVSWNIGAERIKGYRAAEIIGRHFSCFYPEADARAGKCERELKLAARDGRHEDEGLRVRKDGTTFWANVIITALRDKRGKLVGYAKVTRDLTEPRRAEEARLRLAQAEQENHLQDEVLRREEAARVAVEGARDLADAANRAKDEFLASISHELRTPLTAILGWANMLTATTTMDEAKRARALQTIERNAARMAQLIEDLLDVSRITTGKLRLDLAPVELPSVIEAAVDAVLPSAIAKGIRIEQDLAPGAGLIHGDAGRVQQVVWNLLSNAVKFTPAQGCVRVSLARRGAHVEIGVQDSGRGIEPRFLPHVFERFRQADGDAARATGGLGLGLAIVKELVELHGGTVEARSEGLGRGATFTVRLPVAGSPAPGGQPGAAAGPVGVGRAPAQRPAAPLRPSSGAPLPRLDGLRVLVVEDDPDTRGMLRDILTECRAQVTTAASVAEAMGFFARGEVPEAILSDIGMPGETGYDLIRRVRALPASEGGAVPAAALTAFTRAEDRRAVLDAGFQMHVPKPVEPVELVSTVAALARFGDR